MSAVLLALRPTWTRLATRMAQAYFVQVQRNGNCYSIATERCNPKIDPEKLYKFNGITESYCSTIVV